MDYSKYREQQHHEALEFQDFVAHVLLRELGIALTVHNSRRYQFEHGETRQGIEIKHDKQMAQTGNLWIETKEKAEPRSGEYAPAGIYRNDNSWLFVIGDYHRLFVFSKKVLCWLAQDRSFQTLENNTRTSIGFLLPVDVAKQYAEKSFDLEH